MKIRFNRTGEERKTIISAIREILEVKAIYKGSPSFAFDINGIVVDKNGTRNTAECVRFDENGDVIRSPHPMEMQLVQFTTTQTFIYPDFPFSMKNSEK